MKDNTVHDGYTESMKGEIVGLGTDPPGPSRGSVPADITRAEGKPFIFLGQKGLEKEQEQDKKAGKGAAPYEKACV